jgi:glutamyl-tRNA reductase
VDIGVIGLNFKTASVEERELLAKAAYSCFGDEEKAPSWFQGVLVATCNRVELYFSADDLGFLHSRILNLLRSKISRPFEHQLYSYFDRDCFRHLASVIAGLDSAIVAESEIQRQLKIAYDSAALHYHLPPALHFLFQKSLKIAKAVRTLTPLLQPRMSLEQVIYSLWRDFFRSVDNRPILFVGNSQINRHILAYFRQKRVEGFTLCTRSPQTATEHGVTFGDWSLLPRWPEYRFIVCASNAVEPIITLEPLQKLPIHEKTLILDLAIPRNVCPSVKHHPLVHLLDIDDLAELILHHKATLRKEITACLHWIEQEVDKQVAIYRHKRERALEYR